MASVRETLGKSFLLLASTGQGLLAFAKPNRLSDRDQVQNFPPSRKRQEEDSRRLFSWHTCIFLQGSSLAVLLVGTEYSDTLRWLAGTLLAWQPG